MKRHTRAVALLASLLVLLLAGCGGGGGGGGAAGPLLTVLTDWTNRGAPNGGLSEKLDLYNANGLLVQELIVNQDQTGVQTTAFNAGQAGAYHLSAQLWSQRDLGGVQTGYFDTEFTANPSATLHIGVGNTPASVAVTPTSATFPVQSSQQFYAVLKDATNNIVYLPQADVIDWSTLGGVASIGTNGIALGTAPGSGSVRASYAPASLLGGATITITPFVPTTSKWTVLVYMNAANDLDQFSTPNIIQMQKVANIPANLRFVVQWKQAPIPGQSPTFASTRRYLIQPSNGSQVVSTIIQDMGPGIDMGDPQTMADFLNWGMTYFPANRYCVIVWNHGNGWSPGRVRHITDMPTRGFSYDDDTGNHIDTWQLGQSLGALQPDILAWDASLMQMIEVAYEARNQVRYVVGSEESPPAQGYPYDTIFAKFRDNPDDTTANLSKAFVDGMLAAYPPSSGFGITQSVLDESKVPAVATATSALADAMIANVGSLNGLIPYVRANAEAYSDAGPPLNRLYRDLYGVCDILNVGGGGNPPAPLAVQTAAQGVQSALQSAIVWEGHNSLSPNSHGLSIDFSSSTDYLANKQVYYVNLAFAQNTHWPNWLAVAP